MADATTNGKPTEKLQSNQPTNHTHPKNAMVVAGPPIICGKPLTHRWLFKYCGPEPLDEEENAVSM